MSFIKRKNINGTILNTETPKDSFLQKLIQEIPKPKLIKEKEIHSPIKNNNKTHQIYEREKNINNNIILFSNNYNNITKRNLKNNESSFSTSTNSTTLNLNPSVSERYLIKSPKIFSKKIIRNNSFSSKKNTIKENINEINLEDILLIEQKFNELIISFSNKNLHYETLLIIEWWNFYFNCSLNGYIEQYFIDKNSKEIIHFYNNIQFISVMILYELCFFPNLLERNKNKIKSILILIHKNLLLFIDFILQKVNYEFNHNLWVEKIFILLKNKFTINKQNHIYQIKINNEKIYNIINDILLIIQVISNLNNYDNFIFLYNYFYNKEYNEILSLTNVEINNIFFNKIYKCINPNSSQVYAKIKYIDKKDKKDKKSTSLSPNKEIINTIYSNKKKQILLNSKISFSQNNIFKKNNNNENNETFNIPLIKTPSLKKLTLVLDLDETIISFQITNIKRNEGKLLLRPNLKNFLREICTLYEIIIFTSAVKEYADPILNSIEKEEKFFSYRLYRQHTIIIGNYFIKDISILGRDLSKVIIVDNLPQNFKLQKENGILIKSFYGEDKEDHSLFNLKNLLIKIYYEGDDVRNSIKKYRNEILRKVTSTIDFDDEM